MDISARAISLADSLGSEYIDRGKARPACQAIPEIDRKTHITGPKRVSTASVFVPCLSALCNSRHRERPSAFEPHGALRSLMEREKRVTIAACAMAKIGAFDERPCRPGKLRPFLEKCLQLRLAEWRTGKCRHHAGSSVAVLAKRRWFVADGLRSWSP